MSEIGDLIDIAKYIVKIPSEIKHKFDADDSVKLADRYYQKGIIDLALVLADDAIVKNKNNNDALSWLHILKGDSLIEKGMQLYQNKVECPSVFERAIEEFSEAIKIDPFDSVAWLGKGFNHAMAGLIYVGIKEIYVNREENLTKGLYHFHQTISSADAGIGSIEENKPNGEVEKNLWGLKGSAYLLIGDNEDEADKCFEKTRIPKTESE